MININYMVRPDEYLYSAFSRGAVDLLVSSKRVALISNSKRVTYLLSRVKASHVQQLGNVFLKSYFPID